MLVLLATARLTRLVTDDALLDGPREFIQRKCGDLIAYVVGCPWCMSIWLGFAVAAATYAWPHAWPVQIGLLGLAASQISGYSALVTTRLGD